MSDLLNTRPDHKEGTGLEHIFQSKLNFEPLVMPEIVREIVKFIEPKDLSKYRLVCRTWNEEIIPQIKDRLTFCFVSAQQINDFMENGQIFFGFKNLKLKYSYFANSECPSPGDKLLSSHGKLLRRLELDFGPGPDDFHITTVLDIEYMYMKLANSQELQYLKLTQCHYDPMDKYPFPLLPEDTVLPIVLYKLTTIDIDLRSTLFYSTQDYYNQKQSIKTQEFFKQFLRIAPNLQELHLSTEDFRLRYSDSVNSCIQALLSVNPPKLKRLYFHSIISLEWATQLSTRLATNIQKLNVDDLNSLFNLKFDTTCLTGNKIEITAKKELFSGIPASNVISYIQNQLSECEPGVSCTRLLETFLSAFQERIQVERLQVHLEENN